ncbi:glycine zipper 2TM domain-containing protein [Noviherbaspirillum denitrificans]|uniref:Glycine zipper 2TM domain-containing protein n=1 Tax=Noviherbaspirillum denitrificans TaxID=1968433 RepID=A0A254TI23_9BURK|nr:glycine zipper 2TM domain-containing protein [Noviherbaspirillum denitrificans]OWW22290.1 hypothetical protein AYR66_25135 [Noviherbaspirillum denitrificans]
MENTSSNRIHPLVAGAAISVMLVSLTGVAAITGLIPTSHSSSTPSAAAPVAATVGAATAATSPAALVESKPEPKAVVAEEQEPAPVKRAPRAAHASQPRSHRVVSEPAPQVAQAPAVCHSCGRVESVQAIQQAAQPSGVGMVAGAVLGGVLGNQVGGGSGRKIATVAGAVGGGYAGNEIEKHTRATTSYQVRVRMEDGEVRSFPYNHQPSWSVGDRVRVVDGQLTSRG